MYLCHASWPNEELKFGTHTPILIWKWVFEKITLRAASLEKLPCQVDFPHIASIALLQLLARQLILATLYQDKSENFSYATKYLF